jgi:outer membrane protein assembly factor BamD
MKRFVFLGIIAIFAFTGCAWFETKEEKSAQELAIDGMDEFNNRDYKKAIEFFERLKDWYPFSKYAILAELKIADAYYKLEEYEDAIFAYEEFEALHPRNDAIPYVIYQIGLCYFEQIDTIDRDQTTAKKALDTFKRLKKQFPNNPYTKKAQAHIKKCLKVLAGHEFYVGLFYFKSKNYKAALNRFKSIVINYPDVGIHKNALDYIAICKALLQKQQATENSK